MFRRWRACVGSVVSDRTELPKEISPAFSPECQKDTTINDSPNDSHSPGAEKKLSGQYDEQGPPMP